MEVVEIDGSGRLYIPASIRRRVPWRRFRIEVEGDRLILIPLKPAVDKYYGIAAPARFTSPEEIDDAAKVETEKLLRRRGYTLTSMSCTTTCQLTPSLASGQGDYIASLGRGNLVTSSLSAWILYVLTRLENITLILDEVGVALVPLTAEHYGQSRKVRET